MVGARAPRQAFLEQVRTGDGSHTLRHLLLGEPYHSLHGAVSESVHVYVRAGLEAVPGQAVNVLEVGLGTGLNLLLARIHGIERERRVRYTALEPCPLDVDVLRALGHAGQLAWPGLEEEFLAMMTAPDGSTHCTDDGFAFTRLSMPVQNFTAESAFDAVFFDAFAPDAQPEMWAPAVFQRLFRAMRSGGVLVTYCAKGEVRRTLQAAGFRVERLPGPPGKRQMLRAWKPQGP